MGSMSEYYIDQAERNISAGFPESAAQFGVLALVYTIKEVGADLVKAIENLAPPRSFGAR